jgi:hypothetical protein
MIVHGAAPAHPPPTTLLQWGTMIAERLAKIESTLRANSSIPDATRRELLDLVAGLKTEVLALVETHGPDAHEIAGNAEAAVQASIRRTEQPKEAAHAVEGLAASVREFEVTHPRLAEVVEQLASTLSNMGI